MKTSFSLPLLLTYLRSTLAGQDSPAPTLIDRELLFGNPEILAHNSPRTVSISRLSNRKDTRKRAFLARPNGPERRPRAVDQCAWECPRCFLYRTQ